VLDIASHSESAATTTQGRGRRKRRRTRAVTAVAPRYARPKLSTAALGLAVASAAGFAAFAAEAPDALATTTVHYCHASYPRHSGCQGGYHHINNDNSGWATPAGYACVEDYASGSSPRNCAPSAGATANVGGPGCTNMYTEVWNDGSLTKYVNGWLNYS
jgi:hypothetical protein